jgi:hypothetical protein
MNNIQDLVDFSHLDINSTTTIKKPRKKGSKYGIKYEDRTSKYYKTLRKCKIDPFTLDELTDENAFIFPYKWDPYTGERLEFDPYGPLYFNPNNLIRYFYMNRLNRIWIQPSDEDGGYYEGYYGDAVGCGEEFEITSRGHFPEWNLFRLPIIDCYLEPNHNNQIITMGPILTDEELSDIHNKSNHNTYRTEFKQNIPNIINMKNMYGQIISKTPTIDVNNDDTDNIINEKYSIANREAVLKFVNL